MTQYIAEERSVINKAVKVNLFVVNQWKLTLFYAKRRYQLKKSRYFLQNPVQILKKIFKHTYI